jgi:hypothetical protein
MLKLEETFERGTEIVVLYSGGKDSTYTLLKLLESGLFKIHALTFENGFLKKEALVNVANFTNREGVVHRVLRPDARAFGEALRTCGANFGDSGEWLPFFERNGVFCWPCFSFLYDSVYRYARERSIDHIFGGWNPGQIAEGKHKTEDKGQIPFAEVFEAYVSPFADFLRFRGIIPGAFEPIAECSMKLVPYFLFDDYDKEKILKLVRNSGWIEPAASESCTSNCDLNQADRYLYRSRFGRDRYERQIQKMVDKGICDPSELGKVRDEALDERRVREILDGILAALDPRP